jgi:chromosome segregation ATPase
MASQVVKTSLITAGVLLGLAVAVFGFRKTGSYVSTAWNNTASLVRESVSPEFELERIRQQIAALEPDIDKSKGQVAEAKVDLERLQGEVATAKTKLADQKKIILDLSSALENGAKKVSLDGRPLNADAVRTELKRKLLAYDTAEKTATTKQQMLEIRTRKFEVARAQLATLQQQRRDLELVVEKLEAELQAVRLTESESKIQIDDSRLSDIKTSIADVQRRVDVMRAKQALDDNVSVEDNVPTRKPAEDDVLKKVREKFGEPAKDAALAD